MYIVHILYVHYIGMNYIDIVIKFSCLFLEVITILNFVFIIPFLKYSFITSIYTIPKNLLLTINFELCKNDDMLYIISFILLDRQKSESLTISISWWSLK